MDNPEKPVTSGTQDKDKQNKKHNKKTKKTRNKDPTENKQLLPLTRHPPRYSHR
jgi:hypothetical protein